MTLDNCRVVLVRPTIAANVGATARVMHNFGLSQLVLVAPEADPIAPEARKLSTQGEHILHGARTVPTLDEAVTDCTQVVGTSARLGGLFRKQAVGPPEDKVPHLLQGTAALVFGPEPTGLANAEVARCHYLIHIPTSADYPALNLAQAVAICLYELHRARLRQTGVQPSRPTVAPFASLERMFEQLQQALTAIHFLYGPKADSLLFALRHLIARAGPTDMEVDVLFGLARQVRWYVDHHGPAKDSPP